MSRATIGRAVFALTSLLVALSSLRLFAGPVEVVMPVMAQYLPVLPLPIWLHVLGGSVALALVPFQLWRGLRRRAGRLHRAMGYAYVLAILLAAPASLIMLTRFQGSRLALTGFAALGVLWFAFTLLGMRAARRRDLAAHHAWMLRSVALTFGAVTLRLMMFGLMAGAGMPLLQTYDITAWACWLPNLVAVEWWLRRQPRSSRPMAPPVRMT